MELVANYTFCVGDRGWLKWILFCVTDLWPEVLVSDQPRIEETKRRKTGKHGAKRNERKPISTKVEPNIYVSISCWFYSSV